MGILPTRSRPSVVNRLFHSAAARAMVEGVARVLLSQNEETRRNATFNWIQIARSAGDCRLPATSQSVGERRPSDMPTAGGPVALSASLVLKPEVVVAAEPIPSEGVGYRHTYELIVWLGLVYRV